MSKVLSNFVSTASKVSGNIKNISRTLVVGYKFYLFIGPVNLAFNKISGIENNYEYMAVQQGGVNDRLVMLKKPIDQPSRMILEDGGVSISITNMKLYFNSTPKEILIMMCNSVGEILNIAEVHNAVVSKVSLGPFDANRSEVAVNNIEMLYAGFSRLPV